MYERHFGFSRPLFTDGMAQDESVFRTAAAGQISRDLEVALTRKDAVAVISGASGTGKSTLAGDALKGISTRLAFSCISHPPLTAHELLEQLLTDFGFEPYKMSRVERLQSWRQFLSEMAATDTRVCLLVENAESVEHEVLNALHSLTAADAALSPGANVVLTTTVPPESLLITPDTLAFNQRVRLRRQIEPLSEADVSDYLGFKCKLAGVEPGRIFGRDVDAILYEYSGGVIRVIDNLLETALIRAASNGEALVTAAQVAEVAEHQFGMTSLAPAEIDELLEESVPAEAPVFDLADIPTLTEYVA